MKASDYIVELLEKLGVSHIFGIPGVGCGHFLDSVKGSNIKCHIDYHEQAAAFAACAYAQAKYDVGVAFSTAGPGATNLLTGIVNAYSDSIPTVFIVGNKDLSELKRDRNIRFKASQEVDMVSICKPVTKWSYQIKEPSMVKESIEKAFYVAKEGRPGPVVLDIPTDIQRAEINPALLHGYSAFKKAVDEENINFLVKKICGSKRTLFLLGNGLRQTDTGRALLDLCKQKSIPVVLTRGCTEYDNGEYENVIGVIGVDGDVLANKAVQECDMLVIFGARLTAKQIGKIRENFAANAKIIRIDADTEELGMGLRDEKRICENLRDFVPRLIERMSSKEVPMTGWWRKYIDESEEKPDENKKYGEQLMRAFTKSIPEQCNIAIDIGSHYIWFSKVRELKARQRVFQSLGQASMGYGLPAAIGAFYALNQPVVSINGDGGILMNLQELQFLEREQLPITVVVFNNHCYGAIMEFQRKIFDGNFMGTTEDTGYKSADYEGIARAFHMEYQMVSGEDDMRKIQFAKEKPKMVEIVVEG